MGKLLDTLNKQLKTEYKEDAENCLIIYNKLKDINNGHVWESNWNPLVSTSFIGNYPNTKKIYKPTNIGNVFLSGLINVDNLN